MPALLIVGIGGAHLIYGSGHGHGALQTQMVFQPDSLRVYLVDQTGTWLEPEGVSGIASVEPRGGTPSTRLPLRYVSAPEPRSTGYLEADFDFRAFKRYEVLVRLELNDLPGRLGSLTSVHRFTGIPRPARPPRGGQHRQADEEESESRHDAGSAGSSHSH